MNNFSIRVRSWSTLVQQYRWQVHEAGLTEVEAEVIAKRLRSEGREVRVFQGQKATSL